MKTWFSLVDRVRNRSSWRPRLMTPECPRAQCQGHPFRPSYREPDILRFSAFGASSTRVIEAQVKPERAADELLIKPPSFLPWPTDAIPEQQLLVLHNKVHLLSAPSDLQHDVEHRSGPTL
jgi:hypothetical protein